MHFRRGIDGSGGSGRVKLDLSLPEGIPARDIHAVTSEDRPLGSADVYHPCEEVRPSEAYRPSNQQHHALHTAGIHLDNAQATLQILCLPDADRRAILMDVARSLARSEHELKNAYQGSICGDPYGRTATYDYQQIHSELGDLRRSIMRQLHDLSPLERTPILNILNPPFDLL